MWEWGDGGLHHLSRGRGHPPLHRGQDDDDDGGVGDVGGDGDDNYNYMCSFLNKIFYLGTAWRKILSDVFVWNAVLDGYRDMLRDRHVIVFTLSLELQHHATDFEVTVKTKQKK